MKQTLLSITLLLALTVSAASQTDTKTSSYQARPDLEKLLARSEARPENKIRWQYGAPNTDRFVVDGRTVKTLTFDGLTISISLGVERLGSSQIHYDKFVVNFYAINLSERRVEVTPDMITFEAVRPKAKPIKRETAAHLASSVQQWAAVAGALGEFGASMQTTQSNTTGAVYSPDGTTTYAATTTSPDIQARSRASRQAAILNGSASRAGIDLERVELKTNTLMPQQEVGGMLIFDRDKKCQEAVVRVAIDGKIIEFPFAWEAPKKR